ncbi:GNAT family N-acetyltransferase [Deltaproteobacteria bacterium TL4]
MNKENLEQAMKWPQDPTAKKIHPEQLADLIHAGDRIFIGSGCSEPVILTEQLVSNKHRFSDCELIHFLPLSGNKFFDDQEPSLFRHHALFVGESIRAAVNEGKADYIPISLSDIPKLISSGRLRIDVALLQVSPPDQYGFCSLGINVDINRTVADEAKTLIAQINPNMPRTTGDSYIRFSRIDHWVYHEAPLIEFEYPGMDEVANRIGRHCSRLIENGSTLQFGIGSIPNAVLHHLKDKENLAIYSEVLSDSVIELIESGVVNCKENIFPHVMTSFVMGTKKLYDFVDNNPFIEFRPTAFINNLLNISKNRKQISINAALSVSLTGQVNSDSLGTKIYSGVGGQLDFNRGASMSEGGKPLICLPSVTSDGQFSRIVATLEAGAGVVVPRSEVHYVVTEWGIAYLHGKCIRDRVLQMIGIAHPQFRKQLLDEAKKMHFIYEDQFLPQTHGVVAIYPENYEWSHATHSKGEVWVRPVKPTDERMLQELYYSLDPDDRVSRFFFSKKLFTHRETQTTVNVDYESVFALVCLFGTSENQEIVALGSYYLDRDLNVAEIAFTVRKAFRGQGLTRFIIERLIEIAREKGVRGFRGEVLPLNGPMLHLLKTLPYVVHFTGNGDTLAFEFNFSDKKQTPS